jgi:hypothetical protein
VRGRASHRTSCHPLTEPSLFTRSPNGKVVTEEPHVQSAVLVGLFAQVSTLEMASSKQPQITLSKTLLSFSKHLSF